MNLDTAQAAAYLKKCSRPLKEATLKKYRTLGIGPKFYRDKKDRPFYKEEDLIAYMTGPKESENL